MECCREGTCFPYAADPNLCCTIFQHISNCEISFKEKYIHNFKSDKAKLFLRLSFISNFLKMIPNYKVLRFQEFPFKRIKYFFRDTAVLFIRNVF